MNNLKLKLKLDLNIQKIYLASGSPRRFEILSSLGFEIEKLASEIDETPRPNELAQDYVLRMAQEKNRTAYQLNPNVVLNENPNIPVLSADTTVSIDGEILGKPQSPEHAKEMLKRLSGNTHQVFTAVSISKPNNPNELKSLVQTNNVTFKPLTEKEIDWYVGTGEPLDKAGAYGIQGLGGIFVAHLSGSFTGVMGLPIFETVELLKEFER